jgi:hypothetical protein
MIRPVLNVDLPGIVHALDRRARARQGEFANFVVAPDLEEPRSTLAALLGALLPITPNANTWICEDHWRLLGLAQARRRPGAQAWDLAYLAAITGSPAQSPLAGQDEVLLELLQYALDAAMMRGVQRFFARVEDERPELELFGKLGFQCYARELTYWQESTHAALERLGPLAPESLAGHTPSAAVASAAGSAAAKRPKRWDGARRAPGEMRVLRPEIPLRRWHRHDAWGLLRLYDACTPKRVQLAESLTSEEFVHTRAAGGRTWFFPLLEPPCDAFICDRGVRLGGWLRLRHGRGSQPHVLALMAHPDDPGVSLALLRFGLSVLACEAPRPVVAQVRDYETTAVDALRAAGFEHIGTHALLVRHLTMRALRRREVPATEARLAYGLRGLGTAPARLSKGDKAQYARTQTR